MRRWSGLVWMAGGVALGAVLVAGLPAYTPSAAVLQRIPEPLVARVMLAGSAADIVETTRDRYSIALYARPVPVDENTCRIVRYAFWARPDGGFPGTPSDVSQFHAVLKAPDLSRTPIMSTATVAPAGEELISPGATKACADFRDFDHLVSGNYRTLLQVSVLLETARRDIARNRFAFSVTCWDNSHGDAPVSCDGLANLRDVDLKHLSEVWREESLDGERELKETYLAQITYRKHGHPTVTGLRISTEREHETSDPRITAIAIDQKAY